MINKSKNNKHIAKFDYLPGLHIDLTDQPCSIFVDPKSANIFMNEGDGDDRINGAVIFPEDEPLFLLKKIDHNEYYEVRLIVQNKQYHLGTFINQNLIQAASIWCKKSNEHIRSYNLEFSNHLS